MKKLFTILFTLFSLTTLAQYPATQTITSDSTLLKAKGGLQGRMIPFRYSDTTSADRERISQYPGAFIVVGNTAYLRDSTAKKWIAGAGYSYASQVSILNDSSITVCNSGVCDTFKVHNIVVNNFTVINDSSILVCDGNNTCDTIHITPTPISKPYVDSVKAIGFSIYYYINGLSHLGGKLYPDSSYYTTNTALYRIIDSLSQSSNTSVYNIVDSLARTKMDTAFFSSSATADTIIGIKDSSRFVIGIIYSQDRLINGGVVTYSGTGLTYDITNATYRKNAVIYNSPSSSVTLAPSDPTNDRVDLIVADTTGHIVAITGTPSANPSVPQIDPTYGIILTQITVTAGSTTPTVTTSTVYDENTEWATSTVSATANFDNTVNPFHLTKSADVTAMSNGGYLLFTNSSVVNSTNYNTLKFYVRLKTTLSSKSNISVSFYNGSVAVSNQITLGTTYGFNKGTIGAYQNISIPISSFTFTSSSFDRIRITFSGTSFSSFYVDYIQLQVGITSGGTQDLNFVRNVFVSNNNLYELLNGANTLISPIATPQMIRDSISAIPPDTTKVLNVGGGIRLLYANSTDSLFGKTLKAGTNITLAQNSDSSVTINSSASGSPNANIGSGYRLAVPFTNNIKTIFAVNPIGIDSVTNANALTFTFDTTNHHTTAYYNTVYGSLSQQNTNTSNIATNASNISTNTSNIASNTAAIANKSDSIVSFAKNTTRDSTILTFRGGRRLAVRDSVGTGGGGSATWGAITGTLSSQTDLQGALNKKQQNLGWVNVMDFGADSTGATDNSTAFANAIATLPQRGGTLFIPRGQYLFTSTITINKPIKIIGEGEGKNYGWYSTTRITCATDIDVWTITAAGVSITGVGFEWTGASNPVSARALYVNDLDTTTSPNMPNKTQKLTLRDFSVRGFYNNIYIDKCALWDFDNIVVVAAINYGLFIQNLTNQDEGDWCIENSLFVQPTSTPGGYAIYQQGSGGGKITNCKFNAAWNYDIWSTLSNSVILAISNSSFEGFKAEAIHANSIASLSVIGCEFASYGTITGNGYINAISVNGGTISGNNFNGGSLVGTAVYLNGVTNVVLSGNAYVGFTSAYPYNILGANSGGMVREYGKIGIGTGSPGAQLHIVQDGATNASSQGIYEQYYNNVRDGAIFQMTKARGSLAAPSANAVGDIIGMLEFRTYTASGYSLGRSQMGAVQTSANGISQYFGTGTASTGDIPNLLLYENGDAAIGPINTAVYGNGAINPPSARWHIRSGSATTGNALLVQNSTPSNLFTITNTGSLLVWATNTATGTTGAQTINTPTGTVNIAAGGSSVTVTNSLVSTSSIVMAVIRTNDATAVIKNVVPATGSFTITLNAATTAETSIGFWVIN